jgi:transcription elongation factor Elf1
MKLSPIWTANTLGADQPLQSYESAQRFDSNCPMRRGNMASCILNGVGGNQGWRHMDRDDENSEAAVSSDIKAVSDNITSNRLRPTQRRQLPAKHGERQRQICGLCGKSMRITRRQAHPSRGPQYELQTFTCPRCSNVQQVSAASLGAG